MCALIGNSSVGYNSALEPTLVLILRMNVEHLKPMSNNEFQISTGHIICSYRILMFGECFLYATFDVR